MNLPYTEPRCQDALENGCPERKQCRRWVDRYPTSVDTPWRNFAQCRTDAGCTYKMPVTAPKEL